MTQKIIAVETGAARLQAHIEETDHGCVGTVCFSYPERMNAVDLEGWQALPALFESLQAHDDMRLIILSGAGGKAFVAGADISQFEEAFSGPASGRYDKATVDGFDAIANCTVPTLAAIEGHCIGGGLGIALSCDIRLARVDSLFAIPAGRLGLAYPANATQRLVDTVGRAYAKEIIFTAGKFSSQQALEMGLINAIASAEDFAQARQAYIEKICANAPMSLRASKFIIENPDASGEDKSNRLSACLESDDYAEGRQAFMAKRTPIFHGK
jgi:enoyl-CoA hydratase